jgi:hypothetical protein
MMTSPEPKTSPSRRGGAVRPQRRKPLSPLTNMCDDASTTCWRITSKPGGERVTILWGISQRLALRGHAIPSCSLVNVGSDPVLRFKKSLVKGWIRPDPLPGEGPGRRRSG